MRKESDKKNKKTSVTMTYSDFEIIEQKAKEKGMGVSPYMVDKALHCDNSLSPEIKARIQNLINKACMIVEKSEPESVIEFQKEVSEIWFL